MSKEIEVTIDDNGETSVDLKGFDGKGCQEVMDKLTKVLGKKTKLEKKPEFYKEAQQQKERSGDGS